MNDKRCYENARDTALFNGMNVSSRKTNNPSYKRDPNAIHFTSHPQAPGNLHDGMSYPGSNSLSLQQAAAPVTVQPANSPLTQHTSPYLQGNSLSVGAPHHSSLHFTAHVPVSSSPAIPIQTHSQGPTPSSTPPSVPNDSKGHQYQQHNYPAAMSHLFRPVPGGHQFVVNPGNRNHGNRGLAPLPHPRGATTPLFYLAPASNGQQQYIFPTHLHAPLNQMNGGNLMQQSPYPIPSTTTPEQQQLYYQMPPAASTPTFNSTYPTNRGPWNNSNRAASQGGVQLSHNSMLQNSAIYSNISSAVPNVPQQTQQPQQLSQPQQPTHLQQKPKRRSHAVPIVNPDTKEEVKVDGDDVNDEQSARSKETEEESRTRSHFVNEIKKVAQESSRTIPSLQSTVSSSTTLKESATSVSMNGAPSAVTAIAQPITIVPPLSAAERKPSSQVSSSATNQSANTISDSSNSNSKVDVAAAGPFKPLTVLTSVSSAATSLPVKIDYKRPPREEQLPHQQTAAVSAESPTVPAAPTILSPSTIEGSKLRQSAPAWPEMSSVGQVTLSKAPSAAVASAPNKKLAKEPETSGSSSGSTLGSSFSSATAAPSPVAATAAAVTGQDAAHKISTVTTSSSIVVNVDVDSGSTSCAAKGGAPPKQGIPSAGSPSGAGEEAASVAKSTASAKQAVTAASAAVPPQPVAAPAPTPSSGPTAAAGGKSKPKGGAVPSREALLAPGAPTAVSIDATRSSSPAAGAPSTGSAPAEKPAAVAAAAPPAAPVASQPSVAKAAALTQQPQSAHPEEERKAAVGIKEEKPAPHKTGRNRGGNKEAASNENAADHQPSGGKNKSAQPASKHHAVDGAKSNNAQSSAASKQSNGETAEPAAEGNNRNMSKKKQKNKKDSGKKNSEKDSSDVDASIEKAPPVSEKTRGGSSEKASQQQQPQQNANTNATNASSNASSRKTNSSQKSATVTATPTSNETKDNANIVADSKEKVQIQQNIPAVPKLPATPAHTSNKTESVTSDEIPAKRKRYTVEEILSYRLLPQCNQQVKLKPGVPLMVDARFQSSSRSMSQNGYSAANSFMPSFAHPHPHQAASRMSMGGSGRKSQQSMRRDRPPQPIHVSLSLKDDVPLRQSKDAWKPSRLNQPKDVDEETRKTEALNKAVRGILNKLTPEKFPKLIEKIHSLPIDNSSRLEGVIDLIFQKAIDEPGFCRWYAEMCNEMQAVTVINEATDTKDSFRKILLNKCQNEFQREKAAELDSEKRSAEIKACNDPEKKKELQQEFEEMERKMRRKSVGNCRFIGELFKLQMLTAKIMIRCVAQLLSNLEEESLECLCKLLTTIGKDLELKLGPTGPAELDKFFGQMQVIINDKKNKVSSRIRFMLQDVIDLRRNRWVPRREADNPKTIDQMNQEFERKEQDIKLANMLPRSKQHDDYGRRDRDRDRDRDRERDKRNKIDEWTTVTKNFSGKASNQKIDMNKFKDFKNLASNSVIDTLGPQSNHSMWRFGAGGAGAKSASGAGGGMHSMQSSLSARSSVSRLTPSNSTEKPRPFPMSREGDSSTMSRSGSAQSMRPVSRESSVQRAPASRNASQSGPQSLIPPQVDRDMLERYCKTILEEFALNDSLIEDSIRAFTERINPQQINEALECFVNIILEKTKLSNYCGRLFAALFRKKLINSSNTLHTLSTFIEISEDILIDFPRLWHYLAEVFSLLFIEDCLKFSEFETALVEKFPEQRGGPFLLAVRNKLKKPTLSEDLAQNFDSKSFEEMKVWINLKKPTLSEDLAQNFDSKSFEEMKVWINERVEKSQDNPELVADLMRAVCQYFIPLNAELSDDKFFKKFNGMFFKYFKLYVDNKEKLEMKCLVTVADYAREKSFPKGFILNMFKSLYDAKCVSRESFLSWKKDYNNQPGAGVVLTSLKQFFQYIDDSGAGSLNETDFL